MQTSNDLPQTVWLRGDENFFNEFSMRAEQVMDVLGIRRSRLNQISGKELRVGKTRIEQYVRPVYRPHDVEQYMAWTRATATHKRASQALDEATAKLEAKSETIAETFAKTWEQELARTEERLTNHVRAKIDVAQRVHSEENQTTRETTHKIAESIRAEMRVHVSGLRRELAVAQEQASSLASKMETLNVIEAGINQLLGIVEYQKKLLLEQHREQQKLQHAVLETNTQLQQLHAKVEHYFASPPPPRRHTRLGRLVRPIAPSTPLQPEQRRRLTGRVPRMRTR